ncbi:hybrid sensor histidine kinase/response regulator [Desulforhopalus singaporensis]|uniref:histidine kinase n=1 Tax=Desulforhopalus singaporensis TaxID=91360 RepID=A0A1H0LHP4_9BACT|nr:response regulator [Desulforhopalus singaporensis]SDO67450.1 PAS/PAC sensor hybrid histidine kinase [Desulforhopalus singaporensis]
MDTVRVLVVDDEKVIREGVERALGKKGYEVVKAEDGKRGLELLGEHDFDIVLTDLMMPGLDGFAVLEWIRENQPHIQVIVITGFATVTKAVTAMKQGAFDFVGKPFTPDYIRIVVDKAVEKIRMREETERLREEREKGLIAIDKSRSRLKTIFRSMSEAVLITDAHGVVVLHNPAAIRLLEIQTDPVIGKHLADSIHDAAAVSMVTEAISYCKEVSREFTPGAISRKHLRAYCSPVVTEQSKVIGSVTTFLDISAHKEIDRMKSDFVAMVAHELKSPLASVEQMIYALQVGCEYEAQSSCHALHCRMTTRTRDLLRLIDNLLNLSKLESGTVVFNLEPVRGQDIIRDVLEIAAPQAEGKEISIHYEPSAEPWWFNVDYDHMRTAIMNIVSNSIKYTPEKGNIDVSTSFNGGFVNLMVKDTGIGISKDDLPHIFDRFYRVKGKATRHITGSGLGLALVKEVVEAHKGYIEVSSEQERGTTFTLCFPLAGENGTPVADLPKMKP